MSNISGDEASLSAEEELHYQENHLHGSSSRPSNKNGTSDNQNPIQSTKKKRNLPGTPGKFKFTPPYIHHTYIVTYTHTQLIFSCMYIDIIMFMFY